MGKQQKQFGSESKEAGRARQKEIGRVRWAGARWVALLLAGAILVATAAGSLAAQATRADKPSPPGASLTEQFASGHVVPQRVEPQEAAPAKPAQSSEEDGAALSLMQVALDGTARRAAVAKPPQDSPVAVGKPAGALSLLSPDQIEEARSVDEPQHAAVVVDKPAAALTLLSMDEIDEAITIAESAPAVVHVATGTAKRTASGGGCQIFTDQAEFEAFNAGNGKVLKGIEDFEEGTLPPDGVAAMDDPLCGGIPNSPDGFPYPEGLTELNLCVQSNLDGGNAGVPNPRGAFGLAAASAPFVGAASDIVVANYFADSLDVMFGDPVPPDQQDNHTGVGFNTLALLGGDTVDIQVYDKDNNLMASATSPADVGGSNFWGVWCSSTIGRINIFDSAGGAEGGDNIQMWLEDVGCQSDDECDDGNACTDDLCDPADPNADENGCTHGPTDCNDGVGCTIDGCDPDAGCTHDPDDSACNDGDVCNGEETCDPQMDCQDGPPPDCNDSDECTADSCDAEDGCANVDISDQCDDGDACTDDGCDSDIGCVSTPVDCNDDDACTDDACVDGNCENTAIDCDDGDSCTVDECIDGECVNTSTEQTLIIKQGACPAPVNPNSNGVIPMLLVGTDGFDVNDVDLDSLQLRRCDGEGGSATPLADHTKVKDLNHPNDVAVGCGECSCNDDQSSDGIDDLSLKFRTDETLAALGIGAGDGVVTLELTGTLSDGTPFCARDCVVIVPPGSGAINATMQSNVFDTFIEMTPLDLNVDSDGFADFTRTFVEGTTLTLTAPITSDGRRFLRWSVNGEMQAFGIRTIDVTISEDTTLKAFYQRPGRVIPDLPTEGSGDME